MDDADGYQKRATGAQRSMRRGALAWTVSACLLVGIAPAAEVGRPTAAEKTEIRLYYERRDLATPAGARHLLSRIRNAALESCGASAFSFPDYKAATLASECFRDAVDDAVSRIDNPLLSAAAHEARR